MTVTQNVWPITVDYTTSLGVMIAQSKYDFVDDDLTEQRFPLSGTGMVEENVVIAQTETLQGEALIKELEHFGLAPAKIEHLIAFDLQCREACEENIAALGSFWVDADGQYRVPYLRNWKNSQGKYKKRLALSHCGFLWGTSYRYLALRNK